MYVKIMSSKKGVEPSRRSADGRKNCDYVILDISARLRH